MANFRSMGATLTMSLMLSACVGNAPDAAMPGPSSTATAGMGNGSDIGSDSGMGGSDMGMGDQGTLGGSAKTTPLASVTVDSLPPGPLAWSGFPVQGVEHEHAAGFVHAREMTSVDISGSNRPLPAGTALFVPAGTRHRHGSGAAWDVLLAAPDVQPPPGASAQPVFRSEQLQGLPQEAAELRTLLVELPAGAETSVHTHPGPEYIYATAGSFMYENAKIGERRTTQGQHHTLPAGVAVQKRNPGGGDDAAFLSWFVVAPNEPFAPPAMLSR